MTPVKQSAVLLLVVVATAALLATAASGDGEGGGAETFDVEHEKQESPITPPASPTVFFEETFSDGDGWTRRWVNSSGVEHPGKVAVSRGDKWLDETEDVGLRTTEDLRHYALSAKFEPFTNRDRHLVFQFTVKNEHVLRCGGTYLKLTGCDLNQDQFGPGSDYLVMFGPDICGPENRRLHVILNKRGNNHPISKHLKYPLDKLTHQYTFILRPDNSFEVLVDNRRTEAGRIDQDFGILPPMKIDDPDATKPELWDDQEFIEDPNSKKPDDWADDKYVPDPDAVKPEDWDDDIDGTWEPPLIDNPVYQGPWEPKKIKNPGYDGKWTPPRIPNPDYVPDPELYVFDKICGVGLEVWQVESGTIFDNILVTDDAEFARKRGEKTWRPRMERERILNDEEERLKAELDQQYADADDEEEELADAANFQKLAKGQPIQDDDEDADDVEVVEVRDEPLHLETEEKNEQDEPSTAGTDEDHRDEDAAKNLFAQDDIDDEDGAGDNAGWGLEDVGRGMASPVDGDDMAQVEDEFENLAGPGFESTKAAKEEL